MYGTEDEHGDEFSGPRIRTPRATSRIRPPFALVRFDFKRRRTVVRLTSFFVSRVCYRYTAITVLLSSSLTPSREVKCFGGVGARFADAVKG